MKAKLHREHWLIIINALPVILKGKNKQMLQISNYTNSNNIDNSLPLKLVFEFSYFQS